MFLNRGTAITVGLVMIICGAVFLFLPGFTMTMLAMVLGAAFIVAGLSAGIGWWVRLRSTGTGGGILMLGIVAIILGIVCLVHPLAFAESIGWIIAGSVVLSGIVQLVVILTAHDMFGKPAALVSTGISIVLGALALAMPELIVQFLGAALLLDGVTEIAYGILTGRSKSQTTEEVVVITAEAQSPETQTPETQAPETQAPENWDEANLVEAEIIDK